MGNKTACTNCCADIELELNKNCRLVNTKMEQGPAFTHLTLEFEYYCAKCGQKSITKYVTYFNTERVKGFSMQALTREAIIPHSWLKNLLGE
jgi:hypothetical protein